MEVLTNFVGGDLIADEAEEKLELEVPDPAMGELPGRVPPSKFSDVARAAAEASEEPVNRRARQTLGLQVLLGELGESRTRENGKHAGESKGEPPGLGRRAHGGLFGRDVRCGVTGVNVSVPDLVACFPFAGWKDSFFGDLHATGRDGVEFYTGRKVGSPGGRVPELGAGGPDVGSA